MSEGGENEAVGPVGETVAERLTLPLKPVVPVTTMLKSATWVALIVALNGLAEMLKLCALKVTVADWDNEPLAPVTVTDKVGFVGVQVRVTDPEVVVAVNVTLSALRVHAAPAFCEKVTVPVKPVVPADTVIVELPDGEALTESGFAEIVKI